MEYNGNSPRMKRLSISSASSPRSFAVSRIRASSESSHGVSFDLTPVCSAPPIQPEAWYWAGVIQGGRSCRRTHFPNVVGRHARHGQVAQQCVGHPIRPVLWPRKRAGGGSWSVIVIASFAQAKSFGPLVLARSACDLLARGDEFRRRGRKLRPGGVRPWPQRGLPHVLRGSFLQPDDERAQLRARPRALAPAGGLCSGLLAQLGEQRGQALW
jgi:hypothetical protein